MVVVIPAAGYGKRMGKLTRDLPKPMLPLWGKPIIGHILDQIGKAKIRKVVLILGYRAEAICSYVGDGRQFGPLGLDIEYLFQEKLEGTARALALAKPILARHSRFVVQFADIIVPSAWYQKLYSLASCRWDGVLTLNRDNYLQGAAVIMEKDGRIKRIIEKPAARNIKTKWNNAGVALLSPSALEYLPKEYPRDKEISFSETIDEWIAAGAKVSGIEIPKTWYIDVKNQEIYKKLKKQKPPVFLRGRAKT